MKVFYIMLGSLGIFEEKNHSKKISKQNEKFEFKQIKKIFNYIICLFFYFLSLCLKQRIQ